MNTRLIATIYDSRQQSCIEVYRDLDTGNVVLSITEDAGENAEITLQRDRLSSVIDAINQA